MALSESQNYNALYISSFRRKSKIGAKSPTPLHAKVNVLTAFAFTESALLMLPFQGDQSTTSIISPDALTTMF